MSSDRHARYQSFLLRCWEIPKTNETDPPAWRFGVRAVAANGEEVYFGELPALMTFLSQQLNTNIKTDEQPSGSFHNKQGE
jgi:hypothetical protein